MISDKPGNDLLELSFKAVGLGLPPHVITVQLRIYCVSNGHRYMAGETEYVPKISDIEFKKAVRIDYLPNCQQIIQIHCVESDNPSIPSLGIVEVDMGILYEADEGMLLPLLSNGRQIGQINMVYRSVVDDKATFQIGMKCLNVKNVDFFSNSDPYIVIYRPADTHIMALSKDEVPERAWTALHKTEYKKNDLNPVFEPFAMSKWKFCRANLNCLMKFEIWDHATFGRDKIISIGYTTPARIQAEEGKFLNTFDQKNKFGGTIVFSRFDEKKFYLFNEYVDAGVQLRLFIAVDCSGSTKDFHKIDLEGPPDLFEKAIKETSSILINKEKTNRFGLLGFGAKVKGCKHPTFAFNHEVNHRNPSVKSVDEALDLYRKVYPTIEPEEPTNLSAVIERIHMMMLHQDKRNFKIYTLLVVLTDGDINDRQETIDKIVECSQYPLSIILVGIGQKNFDDLEYFESGFEVEKTTDKKKKKKRGNFIISGRLKDSKGVEAARRIVRFVYYQNYMGKPKEFEEALLKDVPKQMTEFYNMMKFDPNPQSDKIKEAPSPLLTSP